MRMTEAGRARLSATGDAPEGDEIARLRVALGRISRMIDRTVSGGGMTRTQLAVLGTVARKGPLGAGELAEHEGINPTLLSRVLGKLEDAGLVRRAPAADDRRAVRVEITADGERLHQQLRAERSRLLADRLGRLPAEQARTLVAALPALEALAAEMAREPVRS